MAALLKVSQMNTTYTKLVKELIFDFLREYNFTITPISRDLEVVKEWYCENCHKMLTSDRVHILATL